MTGIGSPAAKLPSRAETRRTVPPRLVAWTLLRTPESLRFFLRQSRLQADAFTSPSMSATAYREVKMLRIWCVKTENRLRSIQDLSTHIRAERLSGLYESIQKLGGFENDNKLSTIA